MCDLFWLRKYTSSFYSMQREEARPAVSQVSVRVTGMGEALPGPFHMSFVLDFLTSITVKSQIFFVYISHFLRQGGNVEMT